MSSSLNSSAVWLITGCSSGLGKSLAQAVYDLGYNVVATARNSAALAYLPEDSPRVLKVILDVTSKSSIVNAVRSAVDKYGRLDVVINNAGYMLMGDTEGIPEADARLQLETLFWGPVFLMQEAVRVFREVNNPRHGAGGTIVNVTSMGGTVTVAGGAFYHAGKFALEGLTKSMAQEMKPEWNIRFLIFAPGGIRTNFAGTENSGLKLPARHPAYENEDNSLNKLLDFMKHPGVIENWSNPDDCAKLLVDTIRHNHNLPRKLLSGNDAVSYVKLELQNQLKEIEVWEEKSASIKSNGTVSILESH